MKIIKVLGGLGNQMFQYAFYLQQKATSQGSDTLLDISAFDKYKLHNGYELQKVFQNIDHKYATNDELKKLYGFYYYLGKLAQKSSKYIKQTDFGYNQKYLNLDQGYFNGYWQSEKYFKNVENHLREHFEFPELDLKGKELLNDLENKNTVSIHIRRGDYINHPDHGGICDQAYYQKAIKHFNQNIDNCHFMIFSNDIDWCKENIVTKSVSYVDWNAGENSYRDMHLMSLCKHNIIANSSFSWWGAWLNKNPDRIVIAPSKWLNSEQINQTDICPDDWIRIKI
ncbi:alpha-1,2-fucosyltransferase [Francisellaceae bacterium CB52]